MKETKTDKEMENLNLVPGQKYQVFNTKFNGKTGMMSSESTHVFINSFPCYDGRFHGVGNPDDYVAYKFQVIPENFGTVTFFKKDIIEVK